MNTNGDSEKKKKKPRKKTSAAIQGLLLPSSNLHEIIKQKATQSANE